MVNSVLLKQLMLMFTYDTHDAYHRYDNSDYMLGCTMCADMGTELVPIVMENKCSTCNMLSNMLFLPMDYDSRQYFERNTWKIILNAVLPSSDNLRKILLKSSNTVYYTSLGLILDSDFHPLLVACHKHTHNPRLTHRTSHDIVPVIVIDRNAMVRDDLVCKYIRKELLPVLLMNTFRLNISASSPLVRNSHMSSLEAGMLASNIRNVEVMIADTDMFICNAQEPMQYTDSKDICRVVSDYFKELRHDNE